MRLRKNISSATLVTGDLDFRPVVQTLIQFGTYVRLCYMEGSVAKDLLWASDEGLELTAERVHGWTTKEFRSQHPWPVAQQFAVSPDRAFAAKRGALRKRGQIGKCDLESWFTEQDQMNHIVVFCDGGRYLVFTHKDLKLLERLVRHERGEIHWNP